MEASASFSQNVRPLKEIDHPLAGLYLLQRFQGVLVLATSNGNFLLSKLDPGFQHPVIV